MASENKPEEENKPESELVHFLMGWAVSFLAIVFPGFMIFIASYIFPDAESKIGSDGRYLLSVFFGGLYLAYRVTEKNKEKAISLAALNVKHKTEIEEIKKQFSSDIENISKSFTSGMSSAVNAFENEILNVEKTKNEEISELNKINNELHFKIDDAKKAYKKISPKSRIITILYSICKDSDDPFIKDIVLKKIVEVNNDPHLDSNYDGLISMDIFNVDVSTRLPSSSYKPMDENREEGRSASLVGYGVYHIDAVALKFKQN